MVVRLVRSIRLTRSGIDELRQWKALEIQYNPSKIHNEDTVNSVAAKVVDVSRLSVCKMYRVPSQPVLPQSVASCCKVSIPSFRRMSFALGRKVYGNIE